MDDANASAAEEKPAPRWQPLSAIQRRVLGAMIEKAKTTPENYPLSLNALKNACNQKNNRSPLMQLEEPQVDEALEDLRKVGAASQVQGSGRVDKYRHLAYEWLGVDKVELAVMAELLLRGAQTVGELRGRAARMEPIKDMSELTPVLDSLEAKRLVVYLTPPGRGSIVTHTLYRDQEMEKVRREAGAAAQLAAESEPSVSIAPTSRPAPIATSTATPAAPTRSDGSDAQLRQLRDELTGVQRELESVRSEFADKIDELRRGLDELNRQLGN